MMMGRWMRNWLVGMTLLGLAVFAYMALSPKNKGVSLEQEIEEIDSSLIKERQRR